MVDLPQLGLLFAGLGLADPTLLGDADLERSRLVDGLSQFLERLAREGPFALLLDDVHTVRDQLRSRIAPVSVDERTLLDALAVADEPLEHSLLARTGQLTQERTLDALDRLYARGLLSVGAPTSHYELIHALLATRCSSNCLRPRPPDSTLSWPVR